MQITFKRVGEYGQLSRPAKTAGWTLFILGAASCLIAGVLVLHSGAQLVQGLDGKSAAQIQQDIANTIGLSTMYSALFWLALALGFLGMGCFLFGRRVPPASPGKDP